MFFWTPAAMVLACVLSWNVFLTRRKRFFVTTLRMRSPGFKPRLSGPFCCCNEVPEFRVTHCWLPLRDLRPVLCTGRFTSVQFAAKWVPGLKNCPLPAAKQILKFREASRSVKCCDRKARIASRQNSVVILQNEFPVSTKAKHPAEKAVPLSCADVGAVCVCLVQTN